METREHWLTEQNLYRLLDRLDREGDAQNCRLLAKVLLTEVDRFAQIAGNQDNFDNYIAKVDALAEKLRVKVGSETVATQPLFQMTLESLSQIKSTLLSSRNFMCRDIDKRKDI